MINFLLNRFIPKINFLEQKPEELYEKSTINYRDKNSPRFKIDNLLYVRFIILCLSITLLVSNVSAQSKKSPLVKSNRILMSDPAVDKVEISKQRLTPSFITFKSAAQGYRANQAQVVLESYLSLRPGIDGLISDKNVKLNNSDEVIEFQQYFKGIKVDRAKFKAFVNDGNIKFYNGAFYDIDYTVNTTPILNEMEALAKAKSRIGATTYVFNDLLAN